MYYKSINKYTRKKNQNTNAKIGLKMQLVKYNYSHLHKNWKNIAES